MKKEKQRSLLNSPTLPKLSLNSSIFSVDSLTTLTASLEQFAKLPTYTESDQYTVVLKVGRLYFKYLM